MRTQRNYALFLSVTLLTCLACAAEPEFGELPPGSISTSDMSDVDAEICRDHLFDPQTAKRELPTGYRLILAEEVAKGNPSIAALLGADRRHKNYALGSLCFLSVKSFVVDSNPVHPASPMSIAFWWASAEGPGHADMRGKVEWIQLGSWYPSDTAHKSAIIKTDPMAKFVDIDLQRIDPNTWQLRLTLPSETIVAKVRSYGQRTRSKAPQPGYMSVPMSGDSAGYFSVFTYFGHFHQAAQGTWQATGEGIFSEALAIPNEASTFRTVFQNGWAARAALYRFVPQ
jgi:hypothetical protein